MLTLNVRSNTGQFSKQLAGAVVVALALFAGGIDAVKAQSQDRAFQFGLIGDMPYSNVAEQEYQRVLAALNASDLAFVVHVGDFQNDPRAC